VLAQHLFTLQMTMALSALGPTLMDEVAQRLSTLQTTMVLSALGPTLMHAISCLFASVHVMSTVTVGMTPSDSEAPCVGPTLAITSPF